MYSRRAPLGTNLVIYTYSTGTTKEVVGCYCTVVTYSYIVWPVCSMQYICHYSLYSILGYTSSITKLLNSK